MTGERRSDREDGARSSSRRSHARDLRIAAAVSSGLVAGILAVGVLVAPVATFHGWPSPRGSEAGSGGSTVTLPPPLGLANPGSTTVGGTGGVTAPLTGGAVPPTLA